MGILDPWDDALSIAQRLKTPGSMLVTVIGAQAWCEKCRTLKPFFDAQADRAPEHMVWLWLDLEGHADFLGDYVPDSLPQLCIYQHGKLAKKVVLDDTPESLRDALQSLLAGALPLDDDDDPGIYQRLVLQDWAR
ncbi:MAG: thioredoxin family protein [Burkholderiaceae bacterium]|nr:thioredoxin family protein [Burkholderiaceae bacterium]